MKQIISCRMTSEMISKLNVIAKDGGLTRCELIRRMLWFYIGELEISSEVGDETSS